MVMIFLLPDIRKTIWSLFVSDTAGCDSIKIFETTYTKNGRATLAISNPVCCDTLYVVNIALWSFYERGGYGLRMRFI